MFSSNGEAEATKALENGGRLFITRLGRYYLNELIADTQYISSIKYSTYLFYEWSGKWENPFKRIPLLHEIASNAEFLKQKVQAEIDYVNSVVTENQNSDTRYDLLFSYPFSIGEVLEKVLEDVYESPKTLEFIIRKYEEKSKEYQQFIRIKNAVREMHRKLIKLKS